MKEKMLRRLWLFVGLCMSLALVMGASIKVEAASDVINEPGLYQNKKLGVTLTWPAKVMSVNDKLEPGEVVRAKHAQNIPVITMNILDKPKDATPLSEFEKVAKNFKNGLKASQKKSKSKRFKLRESKLVTLANGHQAVYSMTTWKYGGSFGLVTVALTTYKGDKVINVSCTAAPGQPPVEVLDKWIMALVVEP
ncbi:MAG: hypothetical protein HOK67_09120 [Deltaproteobacteria bacterium]|jgi:hypothetical protein|nr:hypothetical protein [Deltaproteobacteria bacterium]